MTQLREPAGIWGKWLITAMCGFGVQLPLATAHAYGDHPPSADEEADRTFHEGRSLLTKGATRQACEAFARSYELRPRHGTLLNLAVCLEQQGDSVAAFHRFEDALAAAVSDGRTDREQLARTHLEDLKTKLGWLSVQLEFVADLPDLDISCDGVSIAKEASAPIAVAPGVHVVKASALGRIPFEVTVVAKAGGSETVSIPTLAVLEQTGPQNQTTAARALSLSHSPPSPQQAERPAAEPSQRWRRPLSISLLAAGTAALSVGAFCGIRALVDADALERLCVDGRCTNDASWSAGQRLEDRARVEARIADITLPLGALALGASVYLLWTKPRPRQSATSSIGMQVSPAISVGALGTSVTGTW